MKIHYIHVRICRSVTQYYAQLMNATKTLKYNPDRGRMSFTKIKDGQSLWSTLL